MPRCKSGHGCPANEDLAADPCIQLFIDQFTNLRLAFEATEIALPIERFYDETGLVHHSAAQILLESYYRDYRVRNAKPRTKRAGRKI